MHRRRQKAGWPIDKASKTFSFFSSSAKAGAEQGGENRRRVAVYRAPTARILPARRKERKRQREREAKNGLFGTGERSIDLAKLLLLAHWINRLWRYILFADGDKSAAVEAAGVVSRTWSARQRAGMMMLMVVVAACS